VVGADKEKPLPKDIPSLKVLAEKGDARAQNELGLKYHIGQGVKKNPKEAVKWIRKAAEQGYANAQYNLGSIYSQGDGVGSDAVRSYKWFFLAERSGHDKAKEARRKMIEARGMTIAQMSEGRQQAKEFKPRVKTKAKEEKQ